MVPLRLLPRIFVFDDEELPPELRAQRQLNKGRVPEMARYLMKNPESYVFSAITASIDGNVHFQPSSDGASGERIGALQVPMDAKFIVNDGQHRRAAIEQALHENPDLGDETIAVVFYIDVGLKRCQQMFADLNRYAIRPSRSLSVLYDHRDDKAELARQIVMQCDVFKDVVDLERSALAQGSKKLFTLSAIYTATGTLLANVDGSPEKRAKQARDFWNSLPSHFPEWQRVQQGAMYAKEVRERFIHSHGVVLHALGKVGNAILLSGATGYKKRLTPLKDIDWRRENAELWEGRATNGGRVVKGQNNVTLTANAIKIKLDMPLTAEEQRVEDAFLRGDYERQN
ncbi:MAG: DNA sulfur modification protein DndB, partial [Kordiimonas sp.]